MWVRGCWWGLTSGEVDVSVGSAGGPGPGPGGPITSGFIYNHAVGDKGDGRGWYWWSFVHSNNDCCGDELDNNTLIVVMVVTIAITTITALTLKGMASTLTIPLTHTAVAM